MNFTKIFYGKIFQSRYVDFMIIFMFKKSHHSYVEEVKYRKLWEIGGKRERGEPRSLLNSVSGWGLCG